MLRKLGDLALEREVLSRFGLILRLDSFRLYYASGYYVWF